MPANPVVVLEGGQKIAFAAGDLTPGAGLLCENQGVRVGAWVPKPGHTSRSAVRRIRVDGVVQDPHAARRRRDRALLLTGSQSSHRRP